MIDHVLGRPSIKFRKYQVFTAVLFWSFYLYKGNPHGPPVVRRLSAFLSTRITAWQTIVITFVYIYAARNFGKVVSLESPEPLANLYSRSYFRATWVTTALDAGFWTAMHLRPKWIRDIASMIFSIYYLVCAEQADAKVRNVRGCLTLDHLRVSWNKPSTPYLQAITALMRPNFMKYKPRALRIPRPKVSSYDEPVKAWLYFNGPLSELKRQTKVVLDIPGGGFVAMSPRDHEDKLHAWAGKTGLPILALDYGKAPEFPYPYALNECYDVYHMLVASNGRCMGLSGEVRPQIVISGDSAGGNLAVGTTLMILQAGTTDSRRYLGEKTLPPPDGLVLLYPALDVNISSWMTDEQMTLISERRTRRAHNDTILRQKSEDYNKLTRTPRHSDDRLDDEDDLKQVTTAIKLSEASTKAQGECSTARSTDAQIAAVEAGKPAVLKTRLAMTSMISYFNDRILSPEMMRAMVILYVGPHNRPDLATDFLLSPLLAPETLLVNFPKVFLLTGERDPLVDDTVIFAGRLRQAKFASWIEQKEMGLLSRYEIKRGFHEEDHVEVTLIPGISHGFVQMVGVFPEGWNYIFRAARWMKELFANADARVAGTNTDSAVPPTSSTARGKANGAREGRHHRRTNTGASSADDDRPLEMSVMKRKTSQDVVPTQSRVRRTSNGKIEKPSITRANTLVRLASHEDLLQRRMLALTDGLTGSVDVDDSEDGAYDS